MSFRKIIFDQNNEIRVERAERIPEIKNGNEILVRNMISHISSGTELACLAGLEDWFKLPNTPGYSSIGEIQAIGDSVEAFKVGDHVFTFGPHAEYFTIDITDRWHGACVKIPDGIEMPHAAFTHMAGIAITAIRKSNIELGDWIGVAGMGAIGNLCAQLAQLQGANVIAIDISDPRLARAEACGLQHLANNATKESLKEIITTITKGLGVSTFIDATGVPSVIEEAIGTINLYGELILLGSPRKAYETDLTKFLQHIHLWSHGSIEVKGALEFTFPTQQIEYIKHSINRNSKIILDLINNKQLVIAPLLTHIEKPENIAKAYYGLRDQPDEYLGVIIDWT